MEKRIFVQDLTEVKEKTMDENPKGATDGMDIPSEMTKESKKKQIKKLSLVCTQCGTRVIVGPGIPGVSSTCPFCGGGQFVTYKRSTK